MGDLSGQEGAVGDFDFFCNDGIESLGNLILADRSKVAQGTDIETENGDVDTGKPVNGAEQSAIAAEDDDCEEVRHFGRFASSPRPIHASMRSGDGVGDEFDAPACCADSDRADGLLGERLPDVSDEPDFDRFR